MTWLGSVAPPKVFPIEWRTRLHSSELPKGHRMSNPHFTHAIAETHRTELYREASRRQLATEAGGPSLWSRLIALRPARRPAAVTRPASTVVGSAPLAERI
jgi:hypothetical protein